MKMVRPKTNQNSISNERSSKCKLGIAPINSENADKSEAICTSTSKKNEILVCEKRDIAISENADVSKNSNVPVFPKATASQVLPSMGLPSKIVMIKVGAPSKVIQNIKTVQTTPSVSSSDVPFIVTRGRYDNTEIKIISIKDLTPQPIVKSNLPKEHNLNTALNILGKHPNPSVHAMPSILQRDPNVTAVPKKNGANIIASTAQAGQNANTISSSQQADHSTNDMASIQQEEQTANDVQSIQQQKEMITNKILNTMFLPIKPKPPGYQGSRPLFIIPSKKKQKPKSKSQPIERKELTWHNCTVCNKKFSKPGNLLQHQRRFHVVKIITGKDYECRICGKCLANPQSRYKHEKHFHPEKHIEKPFYKCAECLSDFQGKRSIKAHISNDHSNINLKPQTITLSSREEFDNWRVAIERDTSAQFIAYNKQSHRGFEKLDFVCHRSSTISINCPLKSTGKRNKKFKGSNKTGFFCPAFIVAKIFATNIEVTFNLTHLGHECDVEYISMRKRVNSNKNCILHRCRECNKVFSSSTNRKLHEKTVHGLDTKYELALKCPICLNTFPVRKLVMYHLSKCHRKIDLQTSYLTFESLKEFDKWKLSMEQETNSEYVLDQAYQKGSYNFRRFNCHLSGSGEKELFCPATVQIRLSPHENNIDVTYISTHIGHDFQSTDKLSLKSSAAKNECLSMGDSHKAAEKIFKNVKVVQKFENTWTVLPFENENCTYEVKQLNLGSSHACKFKCVFCSVCSHQFSCNCSVSLLKLVCIHIHVLYLKHKQYQVNGDDLDNNCVDTIMNYCEQENNAESGNNVLQEIQEFENNVLEIQENPELNNLKRETMSALSSLLVEVGNCNDEAKLKVIFSGISNLKNKISPKKRLTQKKKKPVQKKNSVQNAVQKKNSVQKRKLVYHMNDHQDNVLEKVIKVALQIEDTNSIYASDVGSNVLIDC